MYWTEKAIFVHETPDLFEVHGDWRIHVKKSQVNPAGTFIVTTKGVCSQDQLEISPVSCFSFDSDVG